MNIKISSFPTIGYYDDIEFVDSLNGLVNNSLLNYVEKRKVQAGSGNRV